MAENTRVSQDVNLVGADNANVPISQFGASAGADSATATVSGFHAGAGADSATATVSGFHAGAGADSAAAIVSQFCLLVGRGPEVIPPESNPVSTFTVGAGLRVDWFLALQLSDSGIELRDKVVKDPRVTGKFTSGKLKVYGYGPKEDIDVGDIEDGINEKAMLLLDDSDEVQHSKLLKVNVKNAMTHTVRIEGRGAATGIPDRVDEIVYQVARQGVRR